MNRFDLQKLRDLPIEGVAQRLGLRVSHGHKALCPFHEDHHASLSFNLRKNSCRCFVCMSESMDNFDLVMKRLGVDFVAACRWLADEHHLIVDEWKPSVAAAAAAAKEAVFDAKRYEGFFLRPGLTDEAQRFLFEERRLDPRVIAWCRLTSWRDRQGVNWLQIPFYDAEGELIGVQNRNLQKGALPRFRFPLGSRCGIYNLPVLKRLRPGDELWITEGCSDCWAMLSAGHKAIAIPSATLLSTKDKETLAALANSFQTASPSQPASPSQSLSPSQAPAPLSFHMYPDRDAPGERLFLQLREVLPGLQHHQLPLECKDFSDFYVKQKTSF